ncbi:IS110 family transposase [Vibrio sp. JC009]|uniref:IS110 family transposase n=1 Tax=Vibrio sp. JC009 TaxID=2912314 RepID=UPI0023B185DE|nr:IS110 family transposase [Vibrio sp. JC009]WED22784.1 IS110 family transposase [Vibrio sp. JC009]WED22785.1 IS110 family transposase [Vibrio sp. JC009]WED22786.1 IS110 family transposase [Vibrio sp. JC009]WED22787.1 IS110 family transposase [Vibrio sp. JC009]WED22788.1 IS110 family transposase [Vibrio sp. JC009]
MKNTIVGVDLANDVIQVCVVRSNKVLSNKEMTPQAFNAWLAKSKPVTVIFEACSSANYWQQTAHSLGHHAKQISAKLVAQVRQNQKTDKNDALAVVQASQLPEVRFISGKTFKQQELQSIVRMKDLATKHKVAMENQLRALLREFGIRIAKKGSIRTVIESTLEDAENGFCDEFRASLDAAWQTYQQQVEVIIQHEKTLEQLAAQNEECRTFMAIEGVGPMNAVNMYMLLVCGEMGTFRTGRDASACVGLTPIQHTTGGKVKLGSVGKFVKNHSMRATLVSGAMSVCSQVSRREPRTKKEAWLKALIERRGKRCAAVALANKTIRTAFALIANGTEYRAEPLTA